MNIRQGTEQDIPQIVRLLKISLGESLMPKTELFWRWKHINNPFGKSLVLVAEEKGELIGVRAFMRWEWLQGGAILKAVRAVDTATHPDHQGRGIFRSLTLQLVEHVKDEGVDFIFNTPNAKSKPGYLKMGWFEMGRLPVHIQPRVPFRHRQSDFGIRYNFSEQIRSYEAHGGEVISFPKVIVTNVIRNFLTWRYLENPNVTYHALSNPSGDYLVVFRLKRNRLGTEFRICEKFQRPEMDQGEFKASLQRAIRLSGATFVTYSGEASPLSMTRLPIGPVVTIHSLHNNFNFLSFTEWKPTLGDMEVF